MNYDPYKHNAIDAIRALAESPAMEATLTWDGGSNYRVQPAAKYCSLDDGHTAILTKTDLLDQFISDGDEDDIVGSAKWLENNQREWLGYEQEKNADME